MKVKSNLCPRCRIREKYFKDYCKECKKEISRDWYSKNKIYKIDKSRKYQKETNYASEKTPCQREIRYTKRRTRILYPLKNKFCEFCGGNASEHHHNTNPIEIDKFNFVCHICHNNLNKSFYK